MTLRMIPALLVGFALIGCANVGQATGPASAATDVVVLDATKGLIVAEATVTAANDAVPVIVAAGCRDACATQVKTWIDAANKDMRQAEALYRAGRPYAALVKSALEEATSVLQKKGKPQ